LRKHVCLADKSLEHFEMQHNLFDAVCLELKSMPDNDFQQLGLGSHQPEDMALAAFELLYLNPKHPQYHSIAPCQYNGSKLSIVLPIKRDQKGGDTYGQYTKVWWAFPKAEVFDGVSLDNDGGPTDGVLKNIVEFLEMLFKAVSHRLSKQCKTNLPSYIDLEHMVIMMPVALAPLPKYAQLWRKQRPSKMAEDVQQSA